MVTNYQRGRAFEYKVKTELERLGFFVIRCAGSKPCDLVAFKEGKPPIFIECKTSRGTLRKKYPYGPTLLVRKTPKWREELAATLAGLGYLNLED
ncbi:MAG: hypothetical protein QW794_06770 [Thermosphaera sp.]